MMIDDVDPILRSVGRLPALTPDQNRAERLRARCRAGLKRRAEERGRTFGPALIAGLGFVYLSAVIHDVLRLRGML